MPQPDPVPTPIEVHLNTRDCEPMQPETAAALGRAFQAAHKQLSDSPDPAATLRRLEELRQGYCDSCTIEDVRSLDNALHDLLHSDLIPVMRRAVELEGENARLKAENKKLSGYLASITDNYHQGRLVERREGPSNG